MARKVNFDVTCRYGITYNVELHGSEGTKARTVDMLEKCCCWVCHNRECKEPRNEKFQECNNYCELWTKEPYCERNKKL